MLLIIYWTVVCSESVSESISTHPALAISFRKIRYFVIYSLIGTGVSLIFLAPARSSSWCASLLSVNFVLVTLINSFICKPSSPFCNLACIYSLSDAIKTMDIEASPFYLIAVVISGGALSSRSQPSTCALRMCCADSIHVLTLPIFSLPNVFDIILSHFHANVFPSPCLPCSLVVSNAIICSDLAFCSVNIRIWFSYSFCEALCLDCGLKSLLFGFRLASSGKLSPGVGLIGRCRFHYCLRYMSFSWRFKCLMCLLYCV